jgi:hypothetical protein
LKKPHPDSPTPALPKVGREKERKKMKNEIEIKNNI